MCVCVVYMRVGVCKCVYVYEMYTCTCIHIYTCICTYVHVCIEAKIHFAVASHFVLRQGFSRSLALMYPATLVARGAPGHLPDSASLLSVSTELTGKLPPHPIPCSGVFLFSMREGHLNSVPDASMPVSLPTKLPPSFLLSLPYEP